MSNILKISNCRLSSQSDERFTVHITGGLIEHIDAAEAPVFDSTALNAEGRLLAPGLIDVHIHGAGGADFLDGSEGALRTISHACARCGVTSVVATTMFHPRGENRHLECLREACEQNLGGARIIGIHLEGPFLAPEKRGMIQLDSIGPMTNDILAAIERATGSSLKLITIAPELPGALDAIRALHKRGVVCSIAHSAATYEQARAGIDAGITQATHLFNAMPSIHHRAPGPIPAVLESAPVSVQVIPDCVHVHESILRLLWPILGPERFIAISDGVRSLGLPDGNYDYSGVAYETLDGTARYHDGTLIGTAVGLNALVKRLSGAVGCTIDEALRTATLAPARALGIDKRKGSITEGKDADLVLFNDDLSVWKTFVGGRVVYGENS
jgi:N-acetylglucosamine-6-phosphate deacetylase